MRVSQLGPKSANALLYLAFSDGELAGARLDPKFRTELSKAGLIEARKGKNNRVTLRLLESGWAALAEAFPKLARSGPKTTDAAPAPAGKHPRASAKPSKSTKLTELETLDAVLATLRAFMEIHGISLVEVVKPAPAQRPAPSSEEATVLRAYQRLARGWGHEVRLAALRSELADVPRASVDAVLRRLRDQGRLTPFPIEFAREIKPDDEDAALLLGATHHHYVTIAETGT